MIDLTEIIDQNFFFFDFSFKQPLAITILTIIECKQHVNTQQEDPL